MKAAILYSEQMRNYDFGPGHPFRGERYANFIRLFKDKMGQRPDFQIVEPRPATDEELLLVHTREYIDFIETASKGVWLADPDSFLSLDTPLQPGMGGVARLIAGSALTAAELVWGGQFTTAVGVGGGMHHARSSYGAGFCIYNDVAICVKSLLQRQGLSRVLILDTDAHAGDGTRDIFYEEPRVLFIDLHQDPRTLYPGTGFAHQIGAGEGRGFTVNIPLPPGASYDAYEYALDEVFLPLAREFQPQIILSNGGADPHFADELTSLGMTLAGFKMIRGKVRQMADELCGGKVIDLIGSGYNPVILPLGWLSLVAGLCAVDIELKEPFLYSLRSDFRLEETKEVVKEVKGHLKEYWSCFR